MTPCGNDSASHVPYKAQDFVVLTPRKPLWGEPCNGCGVCCQRSACEIAQEISGDSAYGPCSLLEWDGSKYRCGALRMAARLGEGSEFMLRLRLGIGYGCDSEVGAADTAAKRTAEAECAGSGSV